MTVDPVVLSLPFTGRWLTQNSPVRRVPSHGTHLLASTYAIDFVGVDERHRTADGRDWRTFLATEPAERYVGFGRSILAPADGVVVRTHDGEPDHEGRRSQLALVLYALGQPARLRAGVEAVAGNHVVVALRDREALVAMVHLRRGSLRVSVGDEVVAGQVLRSAATRAPRPSRTCTSRSPTDPTCPPRTGSRCRSVRSGSGRAGGASPPCASSASRPRVRWSRASASTERRP